MKLHPEVTEVIRSNIGIEQQFTIKASPTAFSILSSGLYSDKILAIVRELSCNAWDSHVAAGKQDTPIEVKLPSILDPTFYVKDFGTGLSHEQVTTLYTTYFDSTKTDSNEFIGALGLGSKSPFSYVRSFMVESRQNGMNRIYSCFKNEFGLPSISLLSEAPTDEPNGLTIRLTTIGKDQDSFKTAAKKAFMYFDPQPVIIGYPDFQPFWVNHTIQGSNWKLRETDYWAYYNGPRIVQGFVSYPIDANIFEQEENVSELVKILLKTNIDVIVPIGVVDIAASREALSYDPRTIKNLTEVIEQVGTELYDSIQTQFDECETAWAASTLVTKLSKQQGTQFGELYNKLNKAKRFQWNGDDATRLVHIDPTILQYFEVTTYKLLNSKIRAVHKINDNNNNEILVPKQPVFLYDPHHRPRSYYRYFLHNNDQTLIVIRPVDKKNIHTLVLDELWNVFDNPTFKTTEPLIKKKTQTYANRGSTRVKENKTYWTGFPTIKGNRNNIRRKFSYLCWHDEMIDMQDGGIYVEISSNAVIHNNDQFLYFDDLIEYCTTIGIISTDTKVFGLTQKEQTEIKTNNWVNLFDMVNVFMKDPDTITKIVNSTLVNNMSFLSGYAGTYIKHLIDNWVKYEPEYQNEFGNFVNEVISIQQNTIPYGHYAQKLARLLNCTEFFDEFKKQEQYMTGKWNWLTSSHYPLMDHLNWPTYSSLIKPFEKQIKTYFNLVDNCNKLNDNTIIIEGTNNDTIHTN